MSNICLNFSRKCILLAKSNLTFIANFSQSFARPQVDICSECKGLNVRNKSKNLNANSKRGALAELQISEKRKKFLIKVKEMEEFRKQGMITYSISTSPKFLFVNYLTVGSSLSMCFVYVIRQ